MSMFPFDSNDDEEDEFEFDGDINQLAIEFEQQERDSFSATELLVLYRHYSSTPFENEGKQFDQLKNVLVAGIANYPYMAMFTVHMTELLIEEKKYTLARTYLSEALAFSPSDPILITFSTIVFSLQNKRKKAADMIDQILANVAGDVETLEEVIDVLLYYQQVELALMLYSQAVENDMEVDHLFNQFYNLDVDDENYAKMLPLVQEMVDVDPYNADAWHLLGNLYIEMKDYENAEKALDYARTIDNTYLDAHISYLEAVYENEKYTHFVETYNELTAEFGEHALFEIKGLLAWSTYELGNVEASRALYNQVLTLTPKDYESWFSLGLTYFYEKNYTQALPLLAKAYKNDKKEPDYPVVYAQCLAALSKIDEAEKVYAKASKTFGDNVELWLDWHAMQYSQGNIDRAIDIIEKAFGQLPYHAGIVYRFGAFCYVINQKEPAMLLIETALQINANEHQQMFTFAPELKKSASVLALIRKYTQPKL